MIKKIFFIAMMFVIAHMMSGCSMVINSFTENLNHAVKSSNDPQTIMQALPAYIVLLDGMLEGSPDDKELLLASASLINAYSTLLGAQPDLVEDLPEYQYQKIKNQQKILTKKALLRAERALCIQVDTLCNLTKIKYSELESKLANIHKDDIDTLYRMGTAWVSWLQVNTDDWNAMAQIAQIKLIMQTVADYNENIDNANVHVYLGVLSSLIPSSLGGKPEIGKMHFELAIQLSNESNLMAKVLYAEYYARLMFDEKLHEKLITDILSKENEEHDNNHSLIDTLAIEKARNLQRSAADYF
ncbi:MAG TPA: hypothetical protein ENJ08_11460 [Gammaproteobacteria bacterium]|nr:hypothetical protein [Gammaproteobacteria bacterium]